MHHSLVELPDANYKPRAWDPRSGFGDSPSSTTPRRSARRAQSRYLRRHRLQKVDPKAAVSDPVKPIVYYLDPGAPEPIRSALLEGARWWNQAFEAAGYRNAFRVELLPEGVSPIDIRYNVINWVHRSTRGWSTGGSVIDPRTGEIIKGVVTLGSLRDPAGLHDRRRPARRPTRPAPRRRPSSRSGRSPASGSSPRTRSATRSASATTTTTAPRAASR